MAVSKKITKVPEFEELVFDEKPHTYLLNGIRIPSVTNVMEPLNRARYDGISRKTLDRAAEKGTAVHNSIENYLKFGFVDIPPEHRGYLDGFLAWFEKMNPEVVGSEVKLYHKMMQYAGTIDLLCYIDGDLCLYDFKSTYSVSEMTCGVQLEAYAQALASHGIRVKRKRILHLKKNSEWKEYDFPSNDAARWRVFGACKTVYDYTSSCK